MSEVSKKYPFERGKLEIWAASVIYAIGRINFLFDSSFQPYIKSALIYEYFGTSGNTVSSKARTIMDMFKLRPFFSPEFSTKDIQQSNPLNDLIILDF